ncbi:carboxymuconolactone decarboxylase family protein [Alteribacter aurantiacus]|uniref:carboxymuconolactone decarboxylase family protein n=1 Tax=Alteribacter aurantiacus TaxID=254410 RepID=UPI0004067715|nr:carboxymuconolactone decarboxylase family protein [Alteribacter aurantiacus]
MPWIKPVKQKDIKDLGVYEQLDQPVSIFHRLMAHTPELLESFTPLQQAVKQVTIGDQTREIIITYVSVLNGCEYCTKGHKTVLGTMIDQKEVESLLADDIRLFDPSIQAILNYAKKLVVDRASLSKGDIEELTNLGFSTKEIVEINHVVAYTSYTNQLSIGLGL